MRTPRRRRPSGSARGRAAAAAAGPPPRRGRRRRGEGRGRGREERGSRTTEPRRRRPREPRRGRERDDGEADGAPRRRRRGRRGGKRHRTRRNAYEATFDHGGEGYGLWLDPAVADNPVYSEHWAGHRAVTVTFDAEAITIRRAELPGRAGLRPGRGTKRPATGGGRLRPPAEVRGFAHVEVEGGIACRRGVGQRLIVPGTSWPSPGRAASPPGPGTAPPARRPRTGTRAACAAHAPRRSQRGRARAGALAARARGAYAGISVLPLEDRVLDRCGHRPQASRGAGPGGAGQC